MKSIDSQIALHKPALDELTKKLDDLSSLILHENSQYDNNILLIDDHSRAAKFVTIDVDIANGAAAITADVTKIQGLCKNYKFDMITAAAGKGEVSKLTTLMRGVQPILN